MQFKDFNFSKEVLAGIEAAGFSEALPVQKEVFHTALRDKRDVTVQSQTGSGKTAAFLLTILERFLREPETRHKALIVAPTRELAVQIEQEAKILGSGTEVKVGSFYGGVGYGKQEQLLKEDVDIIIGTPGRLLDFAQSKKLSLNKIDMLVIDEADRLFDMGFLPDLRKMLKQMIKPDKRQTMLFSATITTRVERLAWEFMNNPREITINADKVTVDEINQELYHIGREEKFKLLLGVLDRENPDNALIFTNTKDMAMRLSKRLELNGYQAQYIMGDLPQKKRLSIINRMKGGDLRILVATDVAARGLHINDLPLVVNYDLPEDPENYVHRIGRTARVGKSGKAISLACEKYVYSLESIESFIKMKIPLQWPDETMLTLEDQSADRKIPGLYAKKQAGSKHKKVTYEKKGKKPAPKKGGKSGKPQKKQAPPPKRPAGHSGPSGGKKDVNRPTVASDQASRLEYYRQKYGEDFEFSKSPKPREDRPKQQKEKKLFNNLFGKKKK